MSIELFFPGPRSQRWLRVGPLADDLDGFAADLAAQRYAHESVRNKLRLVRHLSLWLESEGLGAEALDEGRFETFLLTRGPRRAPQGEAATGRQLLAHLRSKGRTSEVLFLTLVDDAFSRLFRAESVRISNIVWCLPGRGESSGVVEGRRRFKPHRGSCAALWSFG